jgi:dethiobiotin synthetase
VNGKYVITGTDTGLGKTTFAAMLMLGLARAGAAPAYWKPVQCGLQGGVDTKTVQKLTSLPEAQFLPERYVFAEPLSPHRAAEIDGTEIDIDTLEIPECAGPLLIEGAGGLMVPLTRTTLLIDIFAIWGLPVILCARTALGTINHTLLSLEALRVRKIPVYGLAFIGEDNPDTMRTIADFSGAPILGRLPRLETLDFNSLGKAFDDNFNVQDFYP